MSVERNSNNRARSLIFSQVRTDNSVDDLFDPRLLAGGMGFHLSGSWTGGRNLLRADGCGGEH